MVPPGVVLGGRPALLCSAQQAQSQSLLRGKERSSPQPLLRHKMPEPSRKGPRVLWDPGRKQLLWAGCHSARLGPMRPSFPVLSRGHPRRGYAKEGFMTPEGQEQMTMQRGKGAGTAPTTCPQEVPRSATEPSHVELRTGSVIGGSRWCQPGDHRGAGEGTPLNKGHMSLQTVTSHVKRSQSADPHGKPRRRADGATGRPSGLGSGSCSAPPGPEEDTPPVSSPCPLLPSALTLSRRVCRSSE